MEKKYYCGWCKKKLDTHPKRFDLLEYTGSYRGYQAKGHYDLCNICYLRVVKFIKDNEIKGYKVKHVKEVK